MRGDFRSLWGNATAILRTRSFDVRFFTVRSSKTRCGRNYFEIKQDENDCERQAMRRLDRSCSRHCLPAFSDGVCDEAFATGEE